MIWPQDQGLKSRQFLRLPQNQAKNPHQSQVTLESPPHAQETVCKLCILFGLLLTLEEPCSWSLPSH